MSSQRKTAIVTGASQGVGTGIVHGFVARGFNVVATSRTVTHSTEVTASDHVALVDGHIGERATAATIVETALARFQSIDALVNNAGIFFTKPFTDYTAEDFRALVATNLAGFLYITQLAITHMVAQQTGGSIVTITAALARNPIRGVPAVPMLTKGGLETITQKARHIGDDPHMERYDPDLWTDEYAFLTASGQAQIQTELFYDYRTNVAAYPHGRPGSSRSSPSCWSSGASMIPRSISASRNGTARTCRTRGSMSSTPDTSRWIPKPIRLRRCYVIS